jgi:hypothetical protein
MAAAKELGLIHCIVDARSIGQFNDFVMNVNNFMVVTIRRQYPL